MTPALQLGFRILLTWAVLLTAGGWGLYALSGYRARVGLVFLIMGGVCLVWVAASVIAHVKRVQLVAGRVDASTLSPRQRRQVEVPYEADAAFDLVEAALHDVPNLDEKKVSRASLRLAATVQRIGPYDQYFGWDGMSLNHVTIVIEPHDCCATVIIISEPETGAWYDWFTVDGATNLENVEGIVRAITRRLGERRQLEQAESRADRMEKELTQAKLDQLQAQIEPHFLYNTLASAQLLTRSDPRRADEMLENLISYLRKGLPQKGESASTLGGEVERSKAYLEILRIRMGARLKVEVDVPRELERAVFPPMMLQTLVENAIKHGLEPKSGGGTIWIGARAAGNVLTVTVADDGCGFGTSTAGAGLGLKNVRDRLKLAFDDAASLALGSNYPCGVAATITLPLEMEGR